MHLQPTPHSLRRSLRAWISSDIDYQGPAWHLWAWTFSFGLLIAVVFTLVGMAGSGARSGEAWLDAAVWWRWFRVNFVISMSVALCIHLAFQGAIALVGRPRIRRFTAGQKGAFFAGVPLTGTLLGWPLGVWLAQDAGWIRLTGASLASSALLGAVLSFGIYLVFDARARQAQAERQAALAQLQLLQAQMEPHFLFNTLANVTTLIGMDPPRARAMVERFTDYLRATLGGLRSGQATVASELSLAQTYLELLQMRMDDRLTWSIRVDAALHRCAVPALLLQPLVENAILHGLEPSVNGGTLVIEGHSQGEAMVLRVRETRHMAPFGPSPTHETTARKPQGTGMALHNVQARLSALYGDAATLDLTLTPEGSTATLTLPSPPCTEPT